MDRVRPRLIDGRRFAVLQASDGYQRHEWVYPRRKDQSLIALAGATGGIEGDALGTVTSRRGDRIIYACRADGAERVETVQRGENKNLAFARLIRWIVTK